MRSVRRIAMVLLLGGLLALAAACRESAVDASRMPSASATPSGAARESTVPGVASTPVPAARFTNYELATLVLEPTEIEAVASRVIVETGGWITNEDASYESWDLKDTERTWERLGRLNGYWLEVWGKAHGADAWISTSVHLFRDDSSARQGFDRWVSDWYQFDSMRAVGAEVTLRGERQLPGVGEQASLLSLLMTGDGLSVSVSAVVLRQKELVGVAILWSEGTELDSEAEEVALRLAERFQRGLDGSLVAEPVLVPGYFRPLVRPPTPSVLADTSLAIPIEGRECPGQGQRVCLVSLGKHRSLDLEELAAYFRETYDLQIAVMPPLDLGGYGAHLDNLVNQGTWQIESWDAVNLVASLLPDVARSPEVTLIVVTPYDLYAQDEPEWNYHYRATLFEEKVSLISVARFDDEAYALPPNPEALWSRTLKLVSREIGLWHYGLPLAPEGDTSTVMTEPYGSPWEIDFYDEYLPMPHR